MPSIPIEVAPATSVPHVHYNFVKNAQSESGTTDVRRAAGVCPIKSFEDAAFMVLRDSRPAIGNPKHRECTGFRKRDRKGSTLDIIFDGVIKQIEQHPPEERFVGLYFNIRRNLEFRSDTFWLNKDLRVFRQLVTDRAKVENFLDQR